MLSEHTFFVIERITDILKVKEEKKDGLSDDVKSGILDLLRELSRIYDYLRGVDSKYDNNLELSDHEQQFYLHLSCIVDSCDDILDRVMNKNDVNVGHDINTLLETFCKSYNPYFTLFQTFIESNNNSGMKQQMGNIMLSLNFSKGKQDSRPKSFGHYPNPHLVGFEHEIKILLNHILQHEETCIVGIVGMGGSGKTTLAKHIYHHPRINTHFTLKLWVCISQSWDKSGIVNSIWRQATQGPTAAEMDYDLIVTLLYNFLSSQLYLIVLDDIWSIDAWYDICPAFPNSRGSKVVITTRRKFLPQSIDPNVLIVEPNPLNDKESYELLERKTCLPNERIPSHLLSLGMEMVKQCKGLPLAIITLAGMLKMHKSQSNWERISKKLTHHILIMGNETTQGVKDILALSYNKLPLHLKPCALYLHVFPEDYEIEAQKLIQIWTAECFVVEESVAQEYLDEMAEQCIVEVVKRNYKGQVHRFRIHDLIRQMFIEMNKERGLLKDPLRLTPGTTLYGDEQKSYDSDKEFLRRYFYGASYARSLILFNLKGHCDLELKSLLKKFRLLRVLILHHISMKGLLKEIGELIHLRYLELSGNSDHLPGSIGNLENLLTLDIRNLVTSTVGLNLEKLKVLRHLYLPKTEKMEVLKLEMLKKLKTLWAAKVGKWMLLGMPNLSDVLQELCVLDIESEETLMAVFKTPSLTSNNLHTLVLSWYSSPILLKDMNILGKCTSLIKLKLRGQIGASIQIMFPPNLIKLEMAHMHIEKKEVMNAISQSCSHLRILVLRDNAYIGSELVCNANSFCQLEKLKLEALNNVKQLIIEESAMPRLQHLTIKGCEYMDFNPQGRKRISMIPQRQRNLPPEFEEKLPAYTTDQDMESSQGTSVSRLFRCDVVRKTILAIFCILFYQLYFRLPLDFY